MKLENVKIEKVIKESGVSKATGSPWETTSIVVKTVEGRSIDSAIVKLQRRVVENCNLMEGQVVDLELGISTREYNGKFYNEVSCWDAKPHSDSPEGEKPF